MDRSGSPPLSTSHWQAAQRASLWRRVLCFRAKNRHQDQIKLKTSYWRRDRRHRRGGCHRPFGRRLVGRRHRRPNRGRWHSPPAASASAMRRHRCHCHHRRSVVVVPWVVFIRGVVEGERECFTCAGRGANKRPCGRVSLPRQRRRNPATAAQWPIERARARTRGASPRGAPRPRRASRHRTSTKGWVGGRGGRDRARHGDLARRRRCRVFVVPAAPRATRDSATEHPPPPPVVTDVAAAAAAILARGVLVVAVAVAVMST